MAKKPATPKLPDMSKKRKDRKKNPTQKTEQQRIMVIGPTGKKRMEWRPW